MKGRSCFFLVSGVGVLLALAGCGRSMLQGERAAWRSRAEAQCMQSGAVKISPAVAQMQPIEGPGMCGADFPLKVAALGESARHELFRRAASARRRRQRCGHAELAAEPGTLHSANVGAATARRTTALDAGAARDRRAGGDAVAHRRAANLCAAKCAARL